MAETLAIYGARGHGRDVLLFVGQNGEDLVYIDDDPDLTDVCGIPVISFEAFAASDRGRNVIIAVADPAARRGIAKKLAREGLVTPRIVATNAVVSNHCTLGEGALIGPFSAISSNVVTGAHFQCNTQVSVAHDCVIGDFVTLSPGALINGNVHIADDVFVGAGAVIRQGSLGAPRRIGAGAVIGMGAVVTADVAAGEVVAGNPARPLKR